jgi:SMI1 / KNR4 family (SUKH-1)
MHHPVRRPSSGNTAQVPGASEESIRDAERRLGVRFPEDYRSYIADQNDGANWFGKIYLMLFPVEDLADLNEAYDHLDRLPGFVIFGSDGGGELFGFDFRMTPPRVVMVNSVSEGWQEAIPQAGSFVDFIERCRAGQGFNFQGSYE